MNTAPFFDPDRRSKAPLVLIFCLIVLIGASLLASLAQKSFGRVFVSNVSYLNYNGINIRAKLLKPEMHLGYKIRNSERPMATSKPAPPAGYSCRT